jgi:ParB/RepB/Spo0J family partition protein
MSSQSTTQPGSLPSDYDDCLPVDQLIHGEHNPRRVSPSAELRESIRKDGLQQPLIVRPDPDQDLFHITDGWQRYQAATALGWERLPVRVFESTLAALEATESASIVREWSSYDWAKYCKSIASELEADSEYKLAQRVAERTVKSQQTVSRYLAALSLPEVVHPLLKNGPAGTEQQWLGLKNYNEDVRRYDGFSWRVGARLGNCADQLPEERVLSIAATAVEYSSTSQALRFVTKSAKNPETPLETVRRQIRWEGKHPKYLEVPRLAIKLERSEKELLMEYCAEERETLHDIVEDQLREFVTELMAETN